MCLAWVFTSRRGWHIAKQHGLLICCLCTQILSMLRTVKQGVGRSEDCSILCFCCDV